MRETNTRAYQVIMTVHASSDAAICDVKDLLRELSWVGHCRDINTDPAYDGLVPSNITIKRMKEKDKNK